MPKITQCKWLQVCFLANSIAPDTNTHIHFFFLSSILFLDSLKMHNKALYAKHIRSWLNCEWQRLGHTIVGDTNAPFNAQSIPVVSPKSRYSVFYVYDIVGCSPNYILIAYNIVAHSSSAPR